MKKVIRKIILIYFVFSVLFLSLLFFLSHYIDSVPIAFGFALFGINMLLILITGNFALESYKKGIESNIPRNGFLISIFISVLTFKFCFIGGGLYFGLVKLNLNIYLLVLGSLLALFFAAFLVMTQKSKLLEG